MKFKVDKKLKLKFGVFWSRTLQVFFFEFRNISWILKFGKDLDVILFTIHDRDECDFEVWPLSMFTEELKISNSSIYLWYIYLSICCIPYFCLLNCAFSLVLAHSYLTLGLCTFSYWLLQMSLVYSSGSANALYLSNLAGEFRSSLVDSTVPWNFIGGHSTFNYSRLCRALPIKHFVVVLCEYNQILSLWIRREKGLKGAEGFLIGADDLIIWWRWRPLKLVLDLHYIKTEKYKIMMVDGEIYWWNIKWM